MKVHVTPVLPLPTLIVLPLRKTVNTAERCFRKKMFGQDYIINIISVFQIKIKEKQIKQPKKPDQRLVMWNPC